MSLKGFQESVTIANGQTISAVVPFDNFRQRVTELHLYPPAALTGVATIEVSLDNSAWFELLDSGGTAINPAVNELTVIAILPSWNYLRINTTVAQAAERTFTLIGVELNEHTGVF